MREKLAQRKAQEELAKYEHKKFLEQEHAELSTLVKKALEKKDQRINDETKEATAAAYKQVLPEHKQHIAEELEKNERLKRRYQESQRYKNFDNNKSHDEL